jgi:hypothetical protein
MKTLYLNVFFANTWQLFLALMHLLFSSILTALLISRELTSYAHTRKFLRVSQPTGLQRSSYFISMPLKFGLPFMGMMALLHWCVSESIFLVVLRPYFSDGSIDVEGRYFTCGTSPAAIATCKLYCT